MRCMKLKCWNEKFIEEEKGKERKKEKGRERRKRKIESHFWPSFNAVLHLHAFSVINDS